MSAWRTAAVFALLILGHCAGAPRPEARAATPPTPLPAEAAVELGATTSEGPPPSIEDLGAAFRDLDTPPLWAERAHQQVLHRIERLQRMQERLAARVESPVPRLDEPLILLTVGGAALVLGFFAGRTVQRRGTRRDRFRL